MSFNLPYCYNKCVIVCQLAAFPCLHENNYDGLTRVFTFCESIKSDRIFYPKDESHQETVLHYQLHNLTPWACRK